MERLIVKIMICLFVFSNVVKGQNLFNKHIYIIPTFGNNILVLDSNYKTNQLDSISITTLKFYITNIELIDDKKIVWKERKSYHLIDASSILACHIGLTIPKALQFNTLRFCVGIDSVTNTSGALGADLDPTKGMYWTWQNGYINFKIEGNSNLCKTRNNAFQFHIGGYKQPYNSLQSVSLSLRSFNDVNINFNVEGLLSNIDLKEQTHIMSPSAKSVFIASKIANTFIVQKP